MIVMDIFDIYKSKLVVLADSEMLWVMSLKAPVRD